MIFMDCRTGSKIVIDQIRIILDLLSDDIYAQNLEIFNGSTIGKHIRHMYDFYYTVVRAEGLGELDYALRDRDPTIECFTESAKEKFSALYAEIDNLNEDEIIDIVSEFDTSQSTLRKRVKSSVGRELMYAYDHAVHHLAIVKMGITSSFPEITIDADLGVAPSTIKHNRSQH